MRTAIEQGKPSGLSPAEATQQREERMGYRLYRGHVPYAEILEILGSRKLASSNRKQQSASISDLVSLLEDQPIFIRARPSKITATNTVRQAVTDQIKIAMGRLTRSGVVRRLDDYSRPRYRLTEGAMLEYSPRPEAPGIK